MTEEVQEVLEQPAVEQAQTDEQTPTSETVEETEKPSEEKAEKTFTQDELDEIVRKRIAKFERKAEKARIESETRQKVEQEFRQQQQTQKVAIDPKDYKTWEEYQDALLDRKVEERLQRKEQETAQQQRERLQHEEVERVKSLEENLYESGAKKYGDFDEIIEDVKDNLTKNNTGFAEAGIAAILESDKSADIIKYFHDKPDEALRIAKLSPYGQAKEIGKIEDKLDVKSPVKTSKAPEPAKPIGSSSSNSKSLADLDMDAYIAERRKQGARWA